MRRSLRTLIVFVLLGAIVNVVVAWSLAATMRPSRLPDSQGVSGNDRHLWQFSRSQAIGGLRISSEWLVYQVEGRSPGGMSPRELPPWFPGDRESPRWLQTGLPDDSQSDSVEAHGWPALSMFTWQRFLSLHDASHASIGSDRQQIAGLWPHAKSGWAGLPTRPIWPGFAINTVFYATILWLLFAAPFALRRRRRIQRGLCPKCAYPIGSNDVCTECGAPHAAKPAPKVASTLVASSKDVQVHLPFQWALGDSIHALAPKVQEHVLQPPGTVVIYRGRMRVWRDSGWRGTVAGWLLRVGVLAKFMFPETGEDVEFKIEHTVTSHNDGSLTMSWIRTFQFDRVTRRFDALMRFHPDIGPVVTWTGCLGCLQVELCPRVENNAIVVVSGHEWLGVGRFRIPISGWLKGRPHVRESQEPDGALRIRVEIHNTLLGHFFGYEGQYNRVEAPTT